MQASNSPRYYFDLRSALEGHAAGDFPFTPAISLIRGLDVALDVILEEGLEQTRRRYQRMAARTREGAGALGLEIYPRHPSDSLTVVRVPNGVDGKAVIDHILREAGIRIAGGQGKLKNDVWRFGHMGYLSEADVEASLAALERALNAVGGAKS